MTSVCLIFSRPLSCLVISYPDPDAALGFSLLRRLGKKQGKQKQKYNKFVFSASTPGIKIDTPCSLSLPNSAAPSLDALAAAVSAFYVRRPIVSTVADH